MINHITFSDKNKYSHLTILNTVNDQDINEIKYITNECVDFINNIDLLVVSVNGLSGNVNIEFPVKSVNGLTGNVELSSVIHSVNGLTGNVNLAFPVLSVNNQTGNVNINIPVTQINNYVGHVKLTLKDVDNDLHYITSDNILVSSVNGLYDDIVLKMSDLPNTSDFVTISANIISSVNGLQDDVIIMPPVNSVNGLTSNVILSNLILSVNEKIGNVDLKTSDLANDTGYITINDMLVVSVKSVNTKEAENLLTKNKKVFVPDKISQFTNDLKFYSALTNILNIKKETVEDKQNFISCRLQKNAAFINKAKCISCNKCYEVCNDNAINVKLLNNINSYTVDPNKCTMCNKCINACQAEAIITKLQ